VILPIATLTAALRALRIHTGDQMGLLLERTGTMMAFNAADAALSVALTAVGVAVGGMAGAAIGTLAAAAILLAATSFYIVRRLHFRPATGALARIGFATLAMAAVLVIAPQPRDVPHLFALIALCVVAYGAMIGLLFQVEARVLRASLA
jgi:O-antigen/teichoic acid export membrane protein